MTFLEAASPKYEGPVELAEVGKAYEVKGNRFIRPLLFIAMT